MWKENKNYSQISRNFYHNSTTKKQLHLRSRFLGIEYQLQLLSCMPWHTAWEISKYGVISGPYFLEFGPITKLFSHSHKKQVNTDQEKSSYLDTFCAVSVLQLEVSQFVSTKLHAYGFSKSTKSVKLFKKNRKQKVQINNFGATKIAIAWVSQGSTDGPLLLNFSLTLHSF